MATLHACDRHSTSLLAQPCEEQQGPRADIEHVAMLPCHCPRNRTLERADPHRVIGHRVVVAGRECVGHCAARRGGRVHGRVASHPHPARAHAWPRMQEGRCPIRTGRHVSPDQW
eukprot:1005571-Prymnesium_polylepis.3